MSVDMLLPTLAFGSMLALLIFGVLGVKGAKHAKVEGETSALARDGESGGATRTRKVAQRPNKAPVA